MQDGSGLPVQRYLGAKGLIVFLALLSAFVPLSTDLFLPALPSMAGYFDTAESITNLTVTLFLIFYGVATLLWGPLSDRFGRRPVLIGGLVTYTVASVLCVVAPNIALLIVFRVLQAIGTGAATATATAIVRDSYQGRQREKILAIVQALVIISPAVAPMIGSLLLAFTSWRGTFVLQTVLGAIVVVGAFLFQESLLMQGSGSLTRTYGRLWVVLKNPGFAWLLGIFSLTAIASLSFIAASSYIYQGNFGTSSRVYSLYFALNALGYLLGPLIYIRLSAAIKRGTIINGAFAVMVLSGILLITVGTRAPWAFALALLPSSVAMAAQRPPSTYLMLEQQGAEDAGSASSLMSSSHMVVGSIGMFLVSSLLVHGVLVIGLLNLIIGSVAGALWVGLRRTPVWERAVKKP